MNVLEAVAGKMRLGWDSPVSEVVNPAFIELNGRGGLGWLKGFNELVTRCGYEWVGHPGGAALGTSLRGGLLVELRTDLLEFGLEVIERTLNGIVVIALERFAYLSNGVFDRLFRCFVQLVAKILTVMRVASPVGRRRRRSAAPLRL